MNINIPPFRPIHYLGSKLRVGEDIEKILFQVDNSNSRVCDLFSGSGTLSGYLARRRPVTSVDIQEYSRVLCEALTGKTSKELFDYSSITDSIICSSYYNRLKGKFGSFIEDENIRIDEAENGNVVPMSNLLEQKGPDLLCVDETDEISSYARFFIERFGGLYFSYRQAIDLTAIVEFAHGLRGHEKYVVLFAAMSAASEVVNTVGKQFAQPIKLRHNDGTPKYNLARQVVKDRRIRVFEKFKEAIEKYNNLPAVVPGSRSLRKDYRLALREDCDDASIIYADPPYTRDHYSRFYHVLETMGLRDSPVISKSSDGELLRGMYRDDRHQSPFCIKSKATSAFDELFSGSRKCGLPLVVSYSPLADTNKPRPRVLSLEDVRRVALRSYSTVDIVPVGNLSHSKLNSEKHNSPVTNGAEVAFVCLGPR